MASTNDGRAFGIHFPSIELALTIRPWVHNGPTRLVVVPCVNPSEDLKLNVVGTFRGDSQIGLAKDPETTSRNDHGRRIKARRMSLLQDKSSLKAE